MRTIHVFQMREWLGWDAVICRFGLCWEEEGLVRYLQRLIQNLESSTFVILISSPWEDFQKIQTVLILSPSELKISTRHKKCRTFWIFSELKRGVNVYTPFADVACLIKSAQAAPVVDLARMTNGCNAAGIVIRSPWSTRGWLKCRGSREQQLWCG